MAVSGNASGIATAIEEIDFELAVYRCATYGVQGAGRPVVDTETGHAGMQGEVGLIVRTGLFGPDQGGRLKVVDPRVVKGRVEPCVAIERQRAAICFRYKDRRLCLRGGRYHTPRYRRRGGGGRNDRNCRRHLDRVRDRGVCGPGAPDATGSRPIAPGWPCSGPGWPGSGPRVPRSAGGVVPIRRGRSTAPREFERSLRDEFTRIAPSTRPGRMRCENLAVLDIENSPLKIPLRLILMTRGIMDGSLDCARGAQAKRPAFDGYGSGRVRPQSDQPPDSDNTSVRTPPEMPPGGFRQSLRIEVLQSVSMESAGRSRFGRS